MTTNTHTGETNKEIINDTKEIDNATTLSISFV